MKSREEMLSRAILFGALCGVLTATAAEAVTPSQVNAADRLYITGSTMTDNALQALFLRTGSGSALPAAAVCKPGTIDVYIDSAAPPTEAHNRATLCTLNVAVSAIPANTNVAFLKESRSLSGEGARIIATGGTASFINLATDAAPACTTTTSIAAGTYASYPSHQALVLHSGCTGLDPGAHPDVGIADVNAALFATSGLMPMSSAEINRLQSAPLYQPMYGFAVSLNLFRMLQAAQGKSTISDSAADMPSLTMGQLRGIFSGTLGDWSTVVKPNGTNPPAKPVFTCRMGDASGGEAAFGSHLLNERCTSGGPSSATANNTSCQENGCAWSFATFGADWVFAGMAASDIRNCLDSHNDHDDFAIGILSSESRYDAPGSAGGAAHASDGTQQFRYIKIDGHTPNLESVANGVYDFVEENVLNRLNTSFNGQSPPSGHKKDLADYVLAGFNSTSVIASLLISQAHGSTGGLAPALAPGVTPNAVPVSTSQLQANAVSLLTRSLNGPPQPCGPAIAVAPALSPFTHLRLNADTAANEK